MYSVILYHPSGLELKRGFDSWYAAMEFMVAFAQDPGEATHWELTQG